MFNTPKWLIFGIIMFGLIHSVSYVMEGGMIETVDDPSLSYGGGLANTLASIFLFDYPFLDGEFWFIRFILATIQAVFVFFALKEVSDWIRGR